MTVMFLEKRFTTLMWASGPKKKKMLRTACIYIYMDGNSTAISKSLSQSLGTAMARVTCRFRCWCSICRSWNVEDSVLNEDVRDLQIEDA